MPPDVDALAKKIWDYHHMNQPLQKADVILILGGHDERVAERGARLFLDGWAPLIVCAGDKGRHTKSWDEPEAERFAEIAIQAGVPKDKILIENKSANTGENIAFTKKLLEGRSVAPNRIIVVTKPYMERRAYATFKKIWPEKECVITSPQISYEGCPTAEMPREYVINIVVGYLQRIKLYAEKGFQIPQEIPVDVWTAYEKLVELGYNKELIKE